MLAAAAAPHKRALVFGTLATLGVVAMRLSLPWPLRGVVENVFPPAAGESGALSLGIDTPGGPVVAFCTLYFLLAVGTGTFEWIQRVWMARAASLTAHDLRAAAVEAASRGSSRAIDRGDLITRVIGDSARIKADLKGILIHLTQNALLLLAITALFLVLAPTLGLLFLLSGLLAVLIGYVTVEEVAETTRRQRKKESRYASAIEAEIGDDEPASTRRLNRSSAKKEVRITRIIGRSTLLIHAAVAATLGFAFWIGVRDVRLAVLAPGELFLFIAYAITIQRRAVMIGRQVARGGKLLANAQRLGALIEAGGTSPEPLRPLTAEIRLEDLRLRAPSSQGSRNRLGPVDLAIRNGERLLVLGGDGAGKSSLLQALAGRADVRRGRVLWDGQEVAAEAVRASAAYLADDVSFGSLTPRSILGLPAHGEPAAADVSLLEGLGVWKVVRKLREGLDQPVSSSELSRRERRALALGGILLGDASIWVLDEPVEADRAKDRARLEHVLERAGDRTLIVALRRPVHADRFARVVVLRKGRIDFDGTPAEWRLRRNSIREIRRA
jgi:ATP-binding cassette subfamily C protein CydC